MNYIQIPSRVLVYYIEGHFFILFFVIGCQNFSFSAILNSFLYLQIQLYDTSLSLSLSLAFMCIRYCAIELRIILHGIHKVTEAKDLCAV